MFGLWEELAVDGEFWGHRRAGLWGPRTAVSPSTGQMENNCTVVCRTPVCPTHSVQNWAKVAKQCSIMNRFFFRENKQDPLRQSLPVLG